MANSTIAKHYTRILSAWPKDLLRPAFPFTRAIERRAVPYGVTPVSPPEQKRKNAPELPALPKVTPEEEAAQINALFSLLENRYQKKYPLSPALRRPESNPEHYDKLLEEIERAPGKSWLQVKWEQMKAKVRWE